MKNIDFLLLLIDLVEAVGNFLTAMNATSWRFNGDTCNLDTIFELPRLSQEANASVGCDCNIGNDSNCHVVIMYKILSFNDIH